MKVVSPPWVNRPPTLDPIANVTVAENSTAQTITLTGITSGSPTEKQALKVTAISATTALVPTPAVHYTSPATTAHLTFKPRANHTGVATITVTVTDGGKSNNIVRQTFTVTVTAPATKNSTSASTSLALAQANLGTDPNAAATLLPVANANGRFSFQVTGVLDGKYVVQASSDLVHWTSVQTNTAPFMFQDTIATGTSQRFYRADYYP